MNSVKNQKALFLMDFEVGLDHNLKELTNIQPEQMLTIRSYGPLITNPYGDLMRSIILAIYQENVEEIFVVGRNDKRTANVNELIQLEFMKDKIQTLEYLFQNSRPEFQGGKVHEWLNGKENGSDYIKESVNNIRHHPLVPSHVKVRGLLVNHKDGKSSIVEVPTKTASNRT